MILIVSTLQMYLESKRKPLEGKTLLVWVKMDRTIRILIIEFIGTFFLVLTIGLSANPIAIGVVLAALVYMGGYISGAHYNPAITLGIWVQRKIKSGEAGIYILVQLIAAIAAAMVYQLIHGGKMS